MAKMTPANLKSLNAQQMGEWQKLPADGWKKLLDGYKKRLETFIIAKGSVVEW